MLSLGLLLAAAAPAAAFQAPLRAPDPSVAGDSVLTREGWQDKERRLRAAIRLNPGEPAFHASLAEALAYQGRFSEAADAYSGAIELAPRITEYRLSYAATLVSAGRVAEAEAQLRAAMRLEPRSAPVRAALGELLASAGRTEEAAGEFERAADLDRSRPEYRELAREARSAARWSWLDGPAAASGAVVASRLLHGLAAVVLILAGLALLLPLLGAIFLVLVAVPAALLRRPVDRTRGRMTFVSRSHGP